MDDNDTSEEELSLDGGGDIEQGRSTIISGNTDSVWSSEAAAITGDTTATSPATTRTPGGLEEVDVEYAAPVPDMEMEKDDITGSDGASTTPTVPPTQDMMLEEIEDGDDAPRPFNSAEFEDDDTAPKIDLGMETADEDDRPPLPFSYERESVSDDAKKKAATPQIIVSSVSNSLNEAADATASAADGSNESVGEDPVVQQTNDHASPAPGDEENNLQQLVEPASDEMRQVVPPAAERYPSLPILEAYLVEDEEEEERVDALPLTAAVATLTPGGRDTVYEATPVEPELPWWKQRRTKVFMIIICILMIALAAGLEVAFSRPIPIAENVPITEIDNNNNTSTSTTAPTEPPNSLPPTQPPTKPSIPIAEADNSSNDDITTATYTGATAPTPPLISLPPTKPSYKCFADRNELKTLVDRYGRDGCGISTTLCTDISNTYGWPMREWCVDEVTDMSSLFEGLDTFDEDISGWRVDRVTDMSRMFADAGMFKQDLSSWNMSSVTSTREMFKGATSFNQNLCAWMDNFPYSNTNDMFVDSGCTYSVDPSSSYQGPFCASTCNTLTAAADCFTTRDELKAAVNKYVQGDWDAADGFKYGWTIGSWCVGNVTDMSALFMDLSEFNEDISQWEVGQVTDMSHMFRGASSFNQDLSSWNTSAVTTMEAMFWEASAFDGNISSWNTSAVTDMSWMFMKAKSFNGDVTSWNTSKVTTMQDMFTRASSFKQDDLSNWDTSAVTNMRAVFLDARSFNGDISTWDTSAATTMIYMFAGASAFNGNISSWNTSAVTDMNWMFMRASKFNGDISSWNTSAVTYMEEMFRGASSFNQNLCSWKDDFPYDKATDIFVDSGCTFLGKPQVEQQGPFCASSCT
eukprot:scaffold18345_cov76-Skeletonema_dohrnii-CCMP3373.AAC.1